MSLLNEQDRNVCLLTGIWFQHKNVKFTANASSSCARVSCWRKCTKVLKCGFSPIIYSRFHSRTCILV